MLTASGSCRVSLCHSVCLCVWIHLSLYTQSRHHPTTFIHHSRGTEEGIYTHPPWQTESDPSDKHCRKLHHCTWHPLWSAILLPSPLSCCIVLVIDFGLVKELMCDPYTNYQCLKLRWASKASMTQRKGRAGRVQAGICFRLMNLDFYLKWCSEHSTPEMLVSGYLCLSIRM